MKFCLIVLLFPLLNLNAELTHLTIEDFDNYLFRDDKTSAQVIFTNPNASSTIKTRFLVAFPAGNSGAVVYFNVNKPAKGFTQLPTVTLVDGSLKSVADLNNYVGIAGKWELNRDDVFIELPVLGSIRTIRDDESGYTHPDMKSHPFQRNANSITYTYNFLSDPIEIQLSISTSKPIAFDKTTNRATLPGGIYDFKVTLNIPSLTPLSAKQLIRTERQSLITDAKTSQAISSLAFLTYKEKFLAGGWHFLTYFGRDTLISTRLLLPLLSTEAAEAALSAVFNRAAEDGQLCHEETIGDYATVINRQNKHPELKSAPFYDYKMIDTNYELLPLLAAYFLDESIGKDRAPTFLASKSKLTTNFTYAQILDLNVKLVLDKAVKFAQNPKFENLVHFKDNLPVGNWRDSEAGNGFGQTPYDVNVALMPSSLLAIERLVGASILKNSTFGSIAADARKVWEEKAMAFFLVTPKFAEDSVKTYLKNLSLPQSLVQDNDTYPKTIHALSLKDFGAPVAVMHSDFSFNLMYHDALSVDFMNYVLSAMQPFPRGLLMDGVGLLIANPAYDLNRTNWNVFSPAAYHGTCVWAFQQTMVVLGLERQLKLCNSSSVPAWCNDTNLVDSLKKAQCKLWSIVDANSNTDYTAETWSWTYDSTNKKFVIINPSELNRKAEEPDAVQLWSFALLSANPPDCPSPPKSFTVSYSNSFWPLFAMLSVLYFKLT